MLNIEMYMLIQFSFRSLLYFNQAVLDIFYSGTSLQDIYFSSYLRFSICILYGFPFCRVSFYLLMQYLLMYVHYLKTLFVEFIILFA
jgi:hypothetical protein